VYAEKEGKSRAWRKKRRRKKKKKEKGTHAAGSLVFLVLRLQFPHDRRCRQTMQSVQSLVQLQTHKGDSFSTHKRQFFMPKMRARKWFSYICFEAVVVARSLW
jgi:hypothetical protein